MYFTIVTKYLYSGDVKGYSHYHKDEAVNRLIQYRDNKHVHDILVITDKFYAGDDVDISIFERQE